MQGNSRIFADSRLKQGRWNGGRVAAGNKDGKGVPLEERSGQKNLHSRSSFSIRKVRGAISKGATG